MSKPKEIRSRESEDWIPNGPIRQAVIEAEAHGTSKSMICERLGWTRMRNGKKCMETSQLDRRIGRRSDSDRHGGQYYSKTINYFVAVEICRAIDRAPYELGL